MGYFDGLTDGSFKKDASGNTLFYPWGILGSGFIIESEEKKNKVRSFYRKLHMVTISIIILVQIFVGFWLNCIILPIYGILYYFISRKITKNLKCIEERLKISESFYNSSKSHNLATLILLGFCSLLFVVSGLWIGLDQKWPLITFASAGFFGLGAIVIGYMIVAKVSDKLEER